MQVVDLPAEQLRPAPWNPNEMDAVTTGRLAASIRRFGVVENLVVRRIREQEYEVLGGNQRLCVLREQRVTHIPCVVVDADDRQARLLAMALNRIRGEDDPSLKAELMRQVLTAVSQPEVLTLLPETARSLQDIASLGKEEMAQHLLAWQRARSVRLHHIQFQLTREQLDIVEEALLRALPSVRTDGQGAQNRRGAALYYLCRKFLETEGGKP